jgi:hypothetical protein
LILYYYLNLILYIILLVIYISNVPVGKVGQ